MAGTRAWPTSIRSVSASPVGLTAAAMRLPAVPSGLATTTALRTSRGAEPSTLTPSAGEYSMVVLCGVMKVQPVRPTTAAAARARDARRRDFTDPPGSGRALPSILRLPGRPRGTAGRPCGGQPWRMTAVVSWTLLKGHNCMLFEVGETVVYPHRGAATIIEVKERVIKGEPKKYLKLNVTQGDLIIEVPAENVDLVG